jgi:HK97 family phage major capsid protein
MPSEVTKRLRDRRLQVWEQCKEMAEQAAGENRSFSAEEQGKWEVLNEEMDTLDKRIKAALDAEQRQADADTAFNRLNDSREGKDRAKQPETRRMNEEIRSFLRGDNGSPRVLEVGRTDNSRIEWNYGPVQYRTLTGPGPAPAGGTGAGAGLIPIDFYDQLISHLIQVSGILQAGPTVLNTSGGETLQIPKTTAHSTAASAAQAGAIPTSDPTFGMATLGAYKYGILLQVARELLDDSGVDLVGYLAMQAGRALGNKFGGDLVTGTGTGQPTGLVGGGLVTTGVTGATTGVGGAAQYNDLVNLEYSVIAPYRQSRSCYWMAADATIGGFRLLVDKNNRPIWEPSMVLGAPDMLLGKPLVADPFMPAVATSAKSIAFGDFSQFFIRLVGPVRFERSDDYLFGSDLVAFRALIRGDGTLVDTAGGAIKLYQGAAT